MILRMLTGLLVVIGALGAQDTVPAAASKAAYIQKQVYPLTTCVVSGEKLDADAVTFEVGGRTFKTCCDKCQAKIEKDAAPFAKKLDEAIVAEQKKGYPLDTCVISGKKLGSMGDPVQLVLDGTLVQLCCDGCTKRATAKGGEMAQKVHDAAFAAQSKTYPLDKCLVSGKALDKDAVSVMFGTQLVKFCCDKCVAKVEKDPGTYLPKLQTKPAAPAKDAAPGKDAAPASKPGEKKAGEKSGEKGEDSAAAGECCDAVDAKVAEKGKATGCCCNAAGATGAAGAVKPLGEPKVGECCEQADAAKAKVKAEPAKDAKPAPKEDAKPKN